MAMAEPLDAPMADSGDIDISMFTGGMATADSWLSAEASMGDIAFSSETATFDYVQEDIEIEMLDDDEPITEYDMAGDGDGYHDLQDVEVHDASRAATPPMVDQGAISHDAPLDDVEFMHVPSSDGDIHAAPSPQHLPEVDANPSVALPHMESNSLPDHTSIPAPSELLEDQQEVAASVNSSVTEVHSPTAHPPEQAQPSTPHVLDPVDSRSIGPAAEEAESSGHHDADGASYRETAEGALVHAEAEEHADLGDRHSTEEAEAHADEGTDGLATEGGDPHEISEGVYIDPPPAVLLTLPPTAEPAECCLFNHPAVPSPVSLRGENTGQAAAESLCLLLHDRPTLYYEPLSSVFDALRHQECVLNIPGSAEAELILDAYELQLAVSEDNVYAHEVTLHELNVIHDGSDLQGPLRLKLKMNSPRFVTRYHQLRDQISRLNFSDGDEFHLEAAVESTSYGEPSQAVEVGQQHSPDNTEPEATHADTEEVQEHSEQGLQDVQPPGSRNEDEAQQPEHSVEEPRQLDEHEGEHEDGSAGVHDDPEDAEAATEAFASHIAEEHAVEEDLGDARTGEVGDAEEHLYTDDIHGQGDEGQGGDYFEHEQFPEDEDEFGDDPLEEHGVQVADVAYTQPGGEDETENIATDTQAANHNVSSDDTLEKPAAPSSTSGVDDEDNDRLLHDHGLNSHGPTNLLSETNSNYDEAEDLYQRAEITSSTSLDAAIRPLSGSVDIPDAHEQATQESNTLPSDDEDGLLDDWDEDDVNADKATSDEHSAHQDALSRKSSTTTLASKTSKRPYDEADLDDFDESPGLPEAASSPDNKRLRTE